MNLGEGKFFFELENVTNNQNRWLKPNGNEAQPF